MLLLNNVTQKSDNMKNKQSKQVNNLNDPLRRGVINTSYFCCILICGFTGEVTGVQEETLHGEEDTETFWKDPIFQEMRTFWESGNFQKGGHSWKASVCTSKDIYGKWQNIIKWGLLKRWTYLVLRHVRTFSLSVSKSKNFWKNQTFRKDFKHFWAKTLLQSQDVNSKVKTLKKIGHQKKEILSGPHFEDIWR